jgi:hypothetical protein
MGNAGFVGQKAAARFERVRERVLAEAGRFASQGTVVGGWREYGGRRLGPCFRLAYRDGRRARLAAQVCASLRHSKVELQRRLAAWGIRLKGFEFRGVRRAMGSAWQDLRALWAEDSRGGLPRSAPFANLAGARPLQSSMVAGPPCSIPPESARADKPPVAPNTRLWHPAHTWGTQLAVDELADRGQEIPPWPPLP